MSLEGVIKEISQFIHIDATLLRIILAFLIVIIGVLFRRLIVKWLIHFLLQLAKKTKTELDEMIIHALDRPAKAFVLFSSFWLAVNVLTLPAALQGFLGKIYRTIIILLVFWFFYRASGSMMWCFERAINKKEKKASPMLLAFFRKAIKAFIILVEVFMIIKEWGFDISGLVAGLGIGGLAISLAAKDAASNLIGSITIMLDKTYKIGDWIETEKVEGTVEELGFRSTKIRTFSDALVTVPNAVMSNEPVTNWSKMGKRKVSYTLQIPLDTPLDKIEVLLEKIKDMLKSHPDVNQDVIAVNLQGFGEATLKVLIHYFTKTTSWVTYLKVTEDVNLKVLRIFEEVDIPITVPVQRMLVEDKPPYQHHETTP